jgi:hypothetical protein
MPSIGQILHGRSLVLSTSPGYGNDGTQTIPPGAISVTTSTIAAAITGRGTDTVLALQPGDYGALSFNTDYSGLTLIGQPGVRVHDIDANGASNLTLSYLEIYRGQGDEPISPGQYSILIANGSDVTVDHVTCTQGDTLESRGTAILIRDAHDIVVSNCKCAKVGNAINGVGDAGDGSDCYNVTIQHNLIDGYVENGVLFLGVQNLMFELNIIINYDISDGGHADTAQFATCGFSGGSVVGADGNTYGLVIQRNYADTIQGEVDPQGIGFMEACNYGFLYQNCSFGVSTNGMSFGNTCTFCLADDNFIQGRDDTFGDAKIIVRDASDHITVTNNWANAFVTAPPNPTNLYMPPVSPSSGAGTNTAIATATDASDTALRDTWLAAHPLTNHP